MTLKQYASTLPNAEWEVDEWNAFKNKGAWLKAHNAALKRAEKAAKNSQQKAARVSRKTTRAASGGADAFTRQGRISDADWHQLFYAQ